MGIYLKLHVVPQGIAAADWEALWQQCRRFLTGHPLQLMCRRAESAHGTERWVFSYDLELHRDDPTRHSLSVIGDLTTMERAESFELPRDLGCPAEARPVDGDLLLSLLSSYGELVEGPPTRTLFGNKTQGTPCHIPLLAVAMLIESHAPGAALVTGDIDRAQAERAATELREALGLDVSLPVVVEPERVVARLQRAMPSTEVVAAALLAQRGARLRTLEVCRDTLGRDALEAWMRAALSDLRVNSVGAVELFGDWLDVVGDVASLAQLSCIDPAGPRYDAEAFVKHLLSTGLTLPADLADPDDWLAPPAGEPDAPLSPLLRMLVGAGLHRAGASLRVEPEPLAATLAGALGQTAAHWRAYIEAETPAHVEHRRELVAALERVDEKVERDWRDGVPDFERLAGVESLDELPDAPRQLLLAFTLRVLDRIERDIADPEVGHLLTRATALKRLLAAHSGRHWVALRETTWAVLDAEDDVELLQLAWSLLTLDLLSDPLARMRSTLLEHPHHCKTLLQWTRDPDRVADARALLDARA